MLDGPATQHPRERAHQIPKLDLLDVVVGQGATLARSLVAQARIALLPQGRLCLERLRRFTQTLEFKQLVDEVAMRLIVQRLFERALLPPAGGGLCGS